MNNRRFTYKENSYHHCWEKCIERYNETISEQEYYALSKNIKLSKKEKIKNVFFIAKSFKKEIYILKFRRKWMIGVYNPEIELLSTFLPGDTFNIPKYYKTCSYSTLALLKSKNLLMSDEEWLENCLDKTKKDDIM